MKVGFAIETGFGQFGLRPHFEQGKGSFKTNFITFYPCASIN